MQLPWKPRLVGSASSAATARPTPASTPWWKRRPPVSMQLPWKPRLVGSASSAATARPTPASTPWWKRRPPVSVQLPWKPRFVGSASSAATARPHLNTPKPPGNVRRALLLHTLSLTAAENTTHTQANEAEAYWECNRTHCQSSLPPCSQKKPIFHEVSHPSPCQEGAGGDDHT